MCSLQLSTDLADCSSCPKRHCSPAVRSVMLLLGIKVLGHELEPLQDS